MRPHSGGTKVWRGSVNRSAGGLYIYLEHPCDHDFHREDIAGDDHELALLCLLGLEIDLNRCGKCVEIV